MTQYLISSKIKKELNRVTNFLTEKTIHATRMKLKRKSCPIKNKFLNKIN